MFPKAILFFCLSFFAMSFFPASANIHIPNSFTKAFNFTGDCSYLFSSPCHISNLSFANEVFADKPEIALKNLNNFIEESYIFKRKFILQKDSNDSSKSDYIMILSEDIEANETIAVFFSQEEVIHSKSFGRSYMKSFPEVDFHLELPPLDLRAPELELAVALLYHLYHINYSKFATDLKLLPREIHVPALSFSEYEFSLLGEESLANTSAMQVRSWITRSYQHLLKQMQQKWSRQEIISFLAGREEIPTQDFLYALLLAKSHSWTTSSEGIKYNYLAPVFMHLKKADTFHLNQTEIYRFITGRSLFSTKILSRFERKEGQKIIDDMYDAKSEYYMMMNGFVPKRNDYDCVDIRVLPEYVAKDWMKDSNGEECFDRVMNQTFINYQIVALNMNMDEEERIKCEMILKRFETNDIQEKQHIVMKRCPFSGYNVVDLWNKTFEEIEEEIKPVLKANLKKTKEYIKIRKELGLDTINGELIRKLWEGKLSLVEDIKQKMSFFREFSLKKIKHVKEAEKMSFDKPFSENKVEL